MKRIVISVLLLAGCGCHRKRETLIVPANWNTGYMMDNDGTVTVYIGAKCPGMVACQAIKRVRVVDQSGATLADITEDSK